MQMDEIKIRGATLTRHSPQTKFKFSATKLAKNFESNLYNMGKIIIFLELAPRLPTQLSHLAALQPHNPSLSCSQLSPSNLLPPWLPVLRRFPL